MQDLETILRQLQSAVANPDQLGPAVKELEAFVYRDGGPYEQLPESVQDVLADLAYDLDFFEPNPACWSDTAGARAVDGGQLVAKG